jgi:hypothetical protein
MSGYPKGDLFLHTTIEIINRLNYSKFHEEDTMKRSLSILIVLFVILLSMVGCVQYKETDQIYYLPFVDRSGSGNSDR